MTRIVFCPAGENACNHTGRGHRCGKRPGHDGAHVCPCYWRWTSPDAEATK